MCLCVGMRMHVLYRHTCTYVYRQEDNVGCLLLSFFSLVFEAGSLTEPGWPAVPGILARPSQHWDCRHTWPLCGRWGLNSGPHTWSENTSPASHLSIPKSTLKNCNALAFCRSQYYCLGLGHFSFLRVCLQFLLNWETAELRKINSQSLVGSNLSIIILSLVN